jgi:sugar lactone lactonase YvrE
VVANTGGRPLGLESAPNGDIYIADARRGLLRLDREGDLHVLVANRPAGPLLFADDVAVTADGVVWFTEASSRRGIEQSLLEFVERHPSGRLWRYAPETGSLTLVADQLGFANGVTVSFDGAALLFAQTSLLRISRYWLSGPKSGEIETFADGLPGYPDNIRADANGRYWIGMVAPRNYADERNGRAPLLRLAIWRLGTLLPQPSARPPVGWVIALDGHGRVVANLRSPRDALVSITSATPTPYGLMLGANRGGAMAAIDPPSYQEDPPID